MQKAGTGTCGSGTCASRTRGSTACPSSSFLHTTLHPQSNLRTGRVADPLGREWTRPLRVQAEQCPLRRVQSLGRRYATSTPQCHFLTLHSPPHFAQNSPPLRGGSGPSSNTPFLGHIRPITSNRQLDLPQPFCKIHGRYQRRDRQNDGQARATRLKQTNHKIKLSRKLNTFCQIML